MSRRYAQHPLAGHSPWGRGDQPPEQNEPAAPRREAAYECAEGHGFTLTFAAAADPPPMWDCPRHGHPALLDGAAGASAPKEPWKADTSPWGLLLKRRTIPQLEAALAERLAEVRQQRGESA